MDATLTSQIRTTPFESTTTTSTTSTTVANPTTETATSTHSTGNQFYQNHNQNNHQSHHNHNQNGFRGRGGRRYSSMHQSNGSAGARSAPHHSHNTDSSTYMQPNTNTTASTTTSTTSSNQHPIQNHSSNSNATNKPHYSRNQSRRNHTDVPSSHPERENGQRDRERYRDKDRQKEKNTVDVKSSKLNPLSKPFVPRQHRKTEEKEKEKVPVSLGTGSVASSAKSPKKEDLHSASHLGSLITEKLNKNTYECLVCFDIIRRTQRIWPCSNCYALFHISCITTWASKSTSESTEGLAIMKNVAKNWRCPNCQKTQPQSPESSCFCGKSYSVEYNPYLLPHSCGDTCGKVRSSTCPHTCTNACHPGPCPPCSSLAPPKKCYCGKLTYQVRCNEASAGRSCEKTCGKVLNCKIHTCDQICHPGVCQNCSIQETRTCFCKKTSKITSCGTPPFSCRQICGKQLSCGNHTCAAECHQGECEECPFSTDSVKRCCCGKTALEDLGLIRKSCLDPLPTCQKSCQKLLRCSHFCAEKCHTGECPPCLAVCSVRCRCSDKEKKVICSKRPELFVCDKTCRVIKTCGKHKCGKKCCDGAFDPSQHYCLAPCKKKLRCGKHFCELLCHRGGCPGCGVVINEQRSCRCGKTVRGPPINCGEEGPPTCNLPCSLDHGCSHPVTHKCHNEAKCPRCLVMVSAYCPGGHQLQHNIPCYYTTTHTQNLTCGRPCGKTLPCNLHSCKKVCHTGPCLGPPSAPSFTTTTAITTTTTQSSTTDDAGGCGQKCGLKLSGCQHNCLLNCHPGTPCPSSVCKQKTKVKCSCGLLSREVECSAAQGLVVECSEACFRYARNAKLAQAFGIPSFTTPLKNSSSASSFYKQLREKDEEVVERLPGVGEGTIPLYSDFLLQAAAANPSFVHRIENTFLQLLNDPSKDVYSFPAMNVNNRRVVHELALVYNVDAASFDKEPNRNVIIRKKAESKAPLGLLSESYKGVSLAKALATSVSTSLIPLPDSFLTDDKWKQTYVHGLQIRPTRPELSTSVIEGKFMEAHGRYVLWWQEPTLAYLYFQEPSAMNSSLRTLNAPGSQFVALPVQTANLTHSSSSSSSSSSFSLSGPSHFGTNGNPAAQETPTKSQDRDTESEDLIRELLTQDEFVETEMENWVRNQPWKVTPSNNHSHAPPKAKTLDAPNNWEDFNVFAALQSDD